MSSESNNITLQPRGTPNHFRALGRIHFAQIYLPDDLLDRAADALRLGPKISGALRDDLIFVEPGCLEQRVFEYLRAVRSDATMLELEARSLLLVESLLRQHHDLLPAAREKRTGGLAPWQVKRACDRMADDLTLEPSLAELAALVRLSPEHFCRAFRQSTGLPPHRWLAQRRIGQAKALLLDPNLSLTEIAQSIGYEGQSAFGAAFRRATGWTPSAWRRERMT